MKKREIKSLADPKELEQRTLNYTQGVTATTDSSEAEINPAFITNSKDHPMTLSYGGVAIVIPPRGKERVANHKLIGAIPQGVTIIRL